MPREPGVADLIGDDMDALPHITRFQAVNTLTVVANRLDVQRQIANETTAFRVGQPLVDEVTHQRPRFAAAHATDEQAEYCFSV